MSASPGRAPISNMGIKNVGSADQVDFTHQALERKVTRRLFFSAHKIFTTWCSPFPNRMFNFKVLAMPYSKCCVHCLSKPSYLLVWKGALRIFYFGNRKHISDIELFSIKIAKMFFKWYNFTQ